MTELLPCPHCHGGSTGATTVCHWTGMRSEVLYGEVRHFCADRNGHPGSNSVVIRKTEAEAVAEWNRRASPWRPMSEAPHGVVVLCRNAAGTVFTAVKVPGDWCDSSGQWRDPIAWMPIPPMVTT